MTAPMVDIDALEGRKPNTQRMVDEDATPGGAPVRRRLLPSLNAVCSECGHHQLVTSTGAVPVYGPEVLRKREDSYRGRPEWQCYVFRTCEGCGAKEARFVAVSRQAVLDDLHKWANYENNAWDTRVRRERAEWHKCRDELEEAGAKLVAASEEFRNAKNPYVWIGWYTDGTVLVQVAGRAVGRNAFPRSVEIEMLREAVRVVRDRYRQQWTPTASFGTPDTTMNVLYIKIRPLR